MKTYIRQILMLLFPLAVVFSQDLRNQKIVDGEFFLNTDPGEGRGIHLGGTYNFWQVNIDTNLNAPAGSRIYVRFKSSNGKWSGPRAILRDSVYAKRGATLQYAEYYVNNDPGRGYGTPLSIQPNGVMSIQQHSLRRGDRLFVRLKDSFNRWSASKPVVFDFKNIQRAEYYIKYNGGGQSAPDSSMAISKPNDTSCVFYATKNNVTFSLQDTLYVRFLTDDRFYSKWTREPRTVVGVNEVSEGIPKKFALYQNFPNPFNPSSTIIYDLPKSSFATLIVYDILGREIALLLNGKQVAGTHQVIWDARGLPSGVYFYRLTAGNFIETKKLMLLK